MITREAISRTIDLWTDDKQSQSVVMTRSIEATGQRELTRRKFCNRLLVTSTAVMLAAKSLQGKPEGNHESLVTYPPLKIEGAERIMPGSFLYFSYPNANDPAVLMRGSEGEYTAYSRKCAHLGCSVDFDPSRRCLSCPCHQGAYDARTGYVLYGPPPHPLDQITLQMRGGGVWAVGRRIGSSDGKV
jgi:Rieske Fe-S protein